MKLFVPIFFHSRYGKYKPLSQPAKCVRCSGKKIKYAYHILCADCVSETGHCAKCNKIEEVVNPPEASVSEAAKLEAEFQRELKLLPERKRRTFLRYLRNQEKSEYFMPDTQYTYFQILCINLYYF